MKRSHLRLSSILSVALLASIPAAAEDRGPEDTGSVPAEGSVEVELRSGPFTLVDAPGGRRIEMQGFGDLKQPGRPMLPKKETLVLLPPGARVLSLEVERLDDESLPGRYAIAPTPALLPLSGSPRASDAAQNAMKEWEEVRRAAYADDGAYPGKAASIAGSGTLRKYSYARVSYRPFTYYASSGRLVHHDRARVRILYTLPDPGSEEARLLERLLQDDVADERAAELFVNFHDLSSLYESASGDESSPSASFAVHDYVIVTTPGNVDAINASGFVGWKQSLGFNVRIVLTTDTEIAGQPGGDLAERIRNFLRAYYAPWGIEHVLLVGEYVDLPMRYCYPDPANHFHDPSDPGTGPGSVPTDLYYADLSLPDADSWDLDGDGFYGEYGEDNPDFLAEVNVGRIPTSVDSRITYTLDKLVRYEEDTGAWKRQALHAGAILFFENQNGGGTPLRDGATYVNEVETHLMQGWTVSRYSEQEGLVTSVFPWPALTMNAFIADWNSGTYGMVNWAGHGWPDGVYRTVWTWDDGDGIPETDGSDGMESNAFIYDWPILQDDYPSIVCAVSCDVAYPEPNSANGRLGVNLLTDPTLGAAAGIMASTRYAAVSGDWPAFRGGAESLCYQFNRYLIAGPGGFKKLGAAVYESKFFVHVNYGWDLHYEFRNMYNYVLYGDPAMDWRGPGVRTGNLLRNTEVSQCDPVSPPLDGILPLDPVEDLSVSDFAAGDTDPDSGNSSPLVFYEIDAPVFIWLTRTPSGEIQIDF